MTKSILLPLIASLLLVESVGTAQEAPRQWRVTEFSFTAKDVHRMPMADVRLIATFVGPDGERCAVPGFWDGGQTWKVRFTPVLPGKWTWSTRSEPVVTATRVLFDSGLMRGGDQAKRVQASIAGVTRLTLIVTDGGDGIDWDHSDWADAKLIAADGAETWLSALKPVSARQGYEKLHLDTNLQGKPLGIANERFAHGLGTHAVSEIVYDLGGRYARFECAAGIDAQSGTHGTVVFRVLATGGADKLPPAQPDAGLDAQRGEFVAAPPDPAEKNPLYAHGGFLRVAKSGHYLTYSDGTPFFWLGDTWWWCPSEMVPFDRSNHPGDPSMFKALVDARVREGFTVAQMAFLTSGGRTPWPEAWIRDHDSPAPDLTAWRLTDRYIAYANEAGLMPALGATWSAVMDRYPLQDWEALWESLIARYGAYSVTWLICGEYNDSAARAPKALALGQYIKEHDPWKRAMTVHPAWHGGDKHQAWDQPWCDFIMIQGSHDTNIPVSVYLNAYRHLPAKPVIEAECNYEGISSQWSKNRHALTDYDVRWAAYRALESGCCGYTYGAHGLWYPKLDEKDTAFVKEYGVAPLWWQALALPGGAQMQFLRAAYESVDWPALEPRPDAILLHPQDTVAHFDQAVLKAEGDKVFLVYLLKTADAGVKFAVKGASPGASYTAVWFDPRTGKSQPALTLRATERGILALPDRPGPEDWLLILRKAQGKE